MNELSSTPLSEKFKQPSASGLLHMRMAESVRVWQIISVILIGIITLQAVALTTLFPLKETKFRYVEFLSSPDVYYKIVPSSELNNDQKALMVRKALRKYVYDRNLKDDITEKQRAEIIRIMSNNTVWAQFKNQFTKMLEQMAKVTRDIEIISDSVIDNGIHQVEFRAIDTNREGQTRVRNYVATLKYEVISKPLVNADTDFLNPLGIKINGYNISERKIKEQ